MPLLDGDGNVATRPDHPSVFARHVETDYAGQIVSSAMLTRPRSEYRWLPTIHALLVRQERSVLRPIEPTAASVRGAQIPACGRTIRAALYNAWPRRLPAKSRFARIAVLHEAVVVRGAQAQGARRTPAVEDATSLSRPEGYVVMATAELRRVDALHAAFVGTAAQRQSAKLLIVSAAKPFSVRDSVAAIGRADTLRHVIALRRRVMAETEG